MATTKATSIIVGADGALSVEMDTGHVAEVGAQPSSLHTINTDTLMWADRRTLDQVKAEKWEEIKAARDAAEHAGFTAGGYPYDSDAVSQQRITGAVTMAMLAMQAGQAFSIDWTIADNRTLPLSASDMIAVGLALGNHVAAQHARARELRDAINTALERGEVNEITWDEPVA